MARTLSAAELPAIEEVHIDTSLPLEQRRRSAIEQLRGNPYDFTCCGTAVHLSFAGECSFEEAVGHYLAMRNNGALPEPENHPAA